jgi:acyl dehydratase
MPALLAPYTVKAFNTAKVSENKIHDDEVAKKFGFGGGLVPGVDVYAYMTHLQVERWGRAWLEHGAAECRFSKPVYDGDHVTVSGTEAAGSLDIKLECRGVLCATGTAAAARRVRADRRAGRPAAGGRQIAAGGRLARHRAHRSDTRIGRGISEQCARDLAAL